MNQGGPYAQVSDASVAFDARHDEAVYAPTGGLSMRGGTNRATTGPGRPRTPT